MDAFKLANQHLDDLESREVAMTFADMREAELHEKVEA